MAELQNFYHLDFGSDDLKAVNVDRVLISGDPNRTERIASKFLKNARLLSDHRGLKFYLAETEDSRPVICATSGMGAPSMSIIVNELYQAGLRKMIRIGTTGAIQSNIQIADVIISQASLCRQGASRDIAPEDFPAAADPFLTLQLVEASKSLKIPYHLGVTASVDSFYEGQERRESANPHLLRRLAGQTEEFQQLGLLNYEMESGTFFKMGLVYGFQAACVCGVVAQRSGSEKVVVDQLKLAEERAILVAIKSLEAL